MVGATALAIPEERYGFARVETCEGKRQQTQRLCKQQRPYTKETKGHKRFERGTNLAVKQGTSGHDKQRLCDNVYVATRQGNTPGKSSRSYMTQKNSICGLSRPGTKREVAAKCTASSRTMILSGKGNWYPVDPTKSLMHIVSHY
jgi:hypothetical protein